MAAHPESVIAAIPPSAAIMSGFIVGLLSCSAPVAAHRTTIATDVLPAFRTAPPQSQANRQALCGPRIPAVVYAA
jgi:hypothetical protein